MARFDNLRHGQEDVTLTQEEKNNLRSSLLTYMDKHPEGSVSPDSLDPIAYGGPSIWSAMLGKWPYIIAALVVIIFAVAMVMLKTR